MARRWKDPGPQVLTTAKAGEVIDDVDVLPACKSKHRGHWLCVTHGKEFANQLQKDIHISPGGAHHMVWVCDEHGLEQP